MGEVVDIYIVSKDKLLFDKLMYYISLCIKDEPKQKVLEIMDNWQYDNLREIETYEILKTYIGKKIVCVTQKNIKGQAGIMVEQKYDYLQYNMWLNSSCSFDYKVLVNELFMDLFDSNSINNMHIGAIGKEIMFDYVDENKLTISNSHNVDVWIIQKEDLNGIDMREYKIMMQKSCADSGKEILVLSRL